MKVARPLYVCGGEARPSVTACAPATGSTKRQPGMMVIRGVSPTVLFPVVISLYRPSSVNDIPLISVAMSYSDRLWSLLVIAARIMFYTSGIYVFLNISSGVLNLLIRGW
ncbi:hypothetical protein [Pseudomonas coronafaciens]|uniref:hypothetical protein n=1 Tax=Pseudomonas coronafaciens TaxID=53409 RepID=UPI0011C39D75|nr:hypothetical protein [Pseudomonas coronafaciens]